MRRDPLDGREVLAAAAECGLDGLHTLAADEILMRAEEGLEKEREDVLAMCQCVCGLLQSVTAGAVNVLEIRDRVAVLVAEVDPALVQGQCFFKGKAGQGRYQRALSSLRGISWEPVAGRTLLLYIIKKGWKEREVGKRVLCLLYALQRDKSVRPRMARSLESIGEAIGLAVTTENKRSAMSAAMKVIYSGLLQAMARRGRSGGHVKAWFGKSEGCKRKLAVSMKGKTNRKKKEAAVPVARAA